MQRRQCNGFDEGKSEKGCQPTGRKAAAGCWTEGGGKTSWAVGWNGVTCSDRGAGGEVHSESDSGPGVRCGGRDAVSTQRSGAIPAQSAQPVGWSHGAGG